MKNNLTQLKGNPYLKDAFEILKPLSKKIADKEINEEWNVIENILWLAIGTERLLKGLLFKINPLYVYETVDFKHSIQSEYNHHVKDKSELAKNPNRDVIAITSCILRMSAVSNSVLGHKNTLFKLKDARDKIAHCLFKDINIAELRILLLRDYYPMLKSISDEHNLKGELKIFNNLHSKLADISSELQEDIEVKINLKVESAQNKYKVYANNRTYDKSKHEISTYQLLKDENVFPCKCPSCGNYGVIHTSPIMEYEDLIGTLIKTGNNPQAFNCHFCDLTLADYKDLDFLKLQPIIEDKERIMSEYEPK